MSEFNPELDAECRQNGIVNVADLALSSVLTALKLNAFNLEPSRANTLQTVISPNRQEAERLHSKLVPATSSVFRNGLLNRRKYIGASAFIAVEGFDDIRIGRDDSQCYPGNRVPVVDVCYLKGAPIRTRFELVAGKPTSDLTGYFFQPASFDYDHRTGSAQEIVDTLRQIYDQRKLEN